MQKRSSIGPGTASSYATAAETYIQQKFNLPSFHARAPDGVKFQKVIADVIAHHRTWYHSDRKKKEPITYPMYEQLWTSACATRDQVGVEGCVFDFLAIGLHTGSRLSEYAQSKVPKGLPFNVIPDGPDKGDPIAFIRDDYVFRNSAGIRQLHSSFLSASHVDFSDWTVTIRFRFDKGPDNYTHKKFQALPGSFLCPVARAISILRRAHLLQLPPRYPVGAFWDYSSSSVSFLTAAPISKYLHAATIRAYPDELHQLRENIDALVPHSIRVTAAVALRAAGLEIPTIALRLRWKPESVATYLRDCWQDIGSLTHAAVRGGSAIDSTGSNS